MTFLKNAYFINMSYFMTSRHSSQYMEELKITNLTPYRLIKFLNKTAIKKNVGKVNFFRSNVGRFLK